MARSRRAAACARICGATPWALYSSVPPTGTSSTPSTKTTPRDRKRSTTGRLWTISWYTYSGVPYSSRARSRLSMAMLTPAQKPRGLARMMRMGSTFDGFSPSPPRGEGGKSVPNACPHGNRGGVETTTPPAAGWRCTVKASSRSLVVLDLARRDDPLLVFLVLAEDAGHRAVLGALADLAVVLLALALVGEVDRLALEVAFLDLDGVAAGLGLTQLALGAADGA